MKKAKFGVIGLCLCLFGCTSIPDVGTRAYVFGQMASVQPGNTPEQVRYVLDGPPHYITAIPQGMDVYEVWEYRVGNFLYAETAMILFKNNRVLALPRSTRELIGIFNSVGIIQQAQFWDQANHMKGQ